MSVRVRPLNDQETEKGNAWRVEQGKICQLDRNSKEPVGDAYSLDNIFSDTWTNMEVYRETTQELIQKVVGGFNGTVFAYGQTSSGKTHTMRGSSTEPGIISLAVNEIFQHITQTQDREFLLRVSYMEVIPETNPGHDFELFGLYQEWSVSVFLVRARDFLATLLFWAQSEQTLKWYTIKF